MVKILISDKDGSEKTIESTSGINLMEALRNNGIDGIVAECGGSLSCATCHVIVAPEWLSKNGEISDMEDDMLDCTATERLEGSRLSCQVELSDALDGLRIEIPEDQI